MRVFCSFAKSQVQVTHVNHGFSCHVGSLISQPAGLTLHYRQRITAVIHVRQRVQQTPGVRMLRVIQIGGGNGFHNASGVHHQHTVAETAHQIDIVTDKYQPQSPGFHQVVEQRQHL
ncbi:hypothetical protein ACFPL2_09685 [Rahnella aquatilis]|uniref:hypothetical protein n=1 Tax=Rahnella aquatilis TaxID=34038 RepID=UPI0036586DD1